ncbi:Alanine--tRNA ligase, cytoplasmic [Nymphon striatum]|nr:Alanine--tRNA ligase, cytoplasmic [Nymphon striatum]
MNTVQVIHSSTSKRSWFNLLHDVFYFTRNYFHPNVSAENVRNQFMQYYIKQHNHLYVHSSPVVLPNDKSLFFVNAGMNQFKPLLLDSIPKGNPLLKYKRVVNYQKCIRLHGTHNDLEDVGKDVYHHTFFEMLGTWSFNDYPEEEACTMAWKLLTEIYRIPIDRLYVTYFGGNKELNLESDEECFNIWKKIGIPENRILACGMKDNFWQMGLTGPCGPCTEIHYDHVGNRHAGHLVNSGDPLVTELWNLVFIQFERKDEFCLERLSKKHIDCGMGFERLVAVLQGKSSNYDTDLFLPILEKIQLMSGMRPYSGCTDENDIDVVYRKIADHIRMISIAIVDGVLPDSKDQGTGDLDERPLLSSGPVQADDDDDDTNFSYFIFFLQVMNIINSEEKKYYRRLKFGKKLIEKTINDLKDAKVFPGRKAWEIQFSNGIPMSQLESVLSDKGISINWSEYEQEVKKQQVESSHNFYCLISCRELRVVSIQLCDFLQKINQSDSEKFKKSQKRNYDLERITKLLKTQNIPPTIDSHKYSYDDSFLEGYGNMKTNVLALIKDGELVRSVGVDDHCTLILKDTQFYAEKDGQVCDNGFIFADECEIEIQSVKENTNFVFHHGIVKAGTLSCSDSVITSIDKEFRKGCMRNHTATHLLNYSVRSVLGPSFEVSSHIDNEYLNFKFQCDGLFSKNGLSNEDLCLIEAKVNEKIMQSDDVRLENLSYDVAVNKQNLISIPGKVYPDFVNVIHIGDFSSEICCGTHVKNTADIQSFAILSSKTYSQLQKSIKAITGKKAELLKDNFIKLEPELTAIESLFDKFSSTDFQLSSEINSQCVQNLKDVEKLLDLSINNRRKIMLRLKEIKSKFDYIYNETLLPSLIEQVNNELSPVVDASQLYLVHSLKVKGNAQILPEYVLEHYNKVPIMVFSKSTNDSIHWCHCSIPQEHLKRGCDARDWGEHVRKTDERL